MNRTLWTLQALLALVFLFTGAVKLALPLELLIQQLPIPGLYIRLIGIAETFGALGLILPWLLRIRPSLTPLAAAALSVLMIGATLLTPTLMDGQVAPALLPLVLAFLTAFVAYGRTRLAPPPRREPQLATG